MLYRSIGDFLLEVLYKTESISDDSPLSSSLYTVGPPQCRDESRTRDRLEDTYLKINSKTVFLKVASATATKPYRHFPLFSVRNCLNKFYKNFLTAKKNLPIFLIRNSPPGHLRLVHMQYIDGAKHWHFKKLIIKLVLNNYINYKTQSLAERKQFNIFDIKLAKLGFAMSKEHVSCRKSPLQSM
jgi:hypothetical protein